MAKKTEKTLVNDPKLREDIASFKASFAFLLYCALVFFTASNFQNNREMYKFRYYLDNHIWLLAIPFGIFAVAAVFRLIAYKNKKDESYSYFSTHDFFGLASLFVIYSLTFTATADIKMYSIVVVGFALGYYAKRLFNNDFYCVTLVNLAVGLGLWLKFGNKLWSSTLSTISAVLLTIGAAATVVLALMYSISTFMPKKERPAFLENALCIFGVNGHSDDSAKSCQAPIFISIVIGIVLGIILQVAPALITLLVAELILLVQYVALGVFYTVKLINQ